MRDWSVSPGTIWTAVPSFFVIFFVCWILLGIGSWIFYSKASYQTKKAWHPFIMIGIAIAFLAFAESITRGYLPWIFVAVVVLITFLNVRNTQFCPRCGATLYARSFTRPRFCSRCGADLQDETPRPDAPAVR